MDLREIGKIAASIRQLGFLNPILVDDADMVLAGHRRLEAARLEGLDQVPVVRFVPEKRSAANQWFTNTLLSRLDDKRTGAIVVVMQRVHIGDLTGFLLGQSDEWDVLSLPAVAHSDEVIPLSPDRTYRRKAGEALSPKREPLIVLDALKLQIGSGAFSAQYQWSPAPPSGAMVKRHWVVRYSELPPASERLFTLQSWDTASKGGPDNDWSVCTTWIVSQKRMWYLVDVWRRRVDYPALKENVFGLAKSGMQDAFWSRTPERELRLFRSCAARSPGSSR